MPSRRSRRSPRKSRPQLPVGRGTGLTITPISYREWNKMYDCNSSIILVFEDEEPVKNNPWQYDQLRGPPPSPTPSFIEDSHLVEIMDGLYIALVDDEDDIPVLRTFDDEPFTHVVEVSYVTCSGDSLSLCEWSGEEAPRDALVQRLSLACPLGALRYEEHTAVGIAELRAARDFLSLALSHGDGKWWPQALRKDEHEYDARMGQFEDEEEDEDENAQYVFLAPDYGIDSQLSEQSSIVAQDGTVNVLIVAPASRAVDVLAVLLCYLAFLEDTRVKHLKMEYFDEVWNKAQELEPWTRMFVDKIARVS